MTANHEFDSITSIVAVGRDGAIGAHNDLPWRLRSDLRFFKQTTINNIVIMGRKTFESIGHCLPNRVNLVLSHRATLFEEHEDCFHTHGIGETLYRRQTWPKKETFLIGGAQTFAEFGPYVDRYLITVVDARFPNADTFLDQSLLEPADDWDTREIAIERLEDPNADEFDFKIIELRHKDPARFRSARAHELQEYIERSNIRPKKKAVRRRANPAPTYSPSLFPA